MCVTGDTTTLFWQSYMEIHFLLQNGQTMDYSLCSIRIFEQIFRKLKFSRIFQETPLKHTDMTPCYVQ